MKAFSAILLLGASEALKLTEQGRSWEQVVGDVIRTVDEQGDKDGMLDDWEAQNIVFAAVDAGVIDQETAQFLEKWWQEKIAAQQCDAKTFTRELKQLAEQHMKAGEVTDKELDKFSREVEAALKDHYHQTPAQFNEEDEIKRVYSHVFAMLDHADSDGKIHEWEFKEMMQAAANFGLIKQEEAGEAEAWFAKNKLSGADFEEFGSALQDMVEDEGIPPLDFLYTVEHVMSQVLMQSAPVPHPPMPPTDPWQDGYNTGFQDAWRQAEQYAFDMGLMQGNGTQGNSTSPMGPSPMGPSPMGPSPVNGTSPMGPYGPSPVNGTSPMPPMDGYKN